MNIREIEEGTRCWKGYEKKGMKTMFGKRVPNCVKKEGLEEYDYNDDEAFFEEYGWIEDNQVYIQDNQVYPCDHVCVRSH